MIDSRKLAELLQTHLLPTIWVPDLETRRRRHLLRGRAFRSSLSRVDATDLRSARRILDRMNADHRFELDVG